MGNQKAKAPQGQSRCKALTANGVQSNAALKDVDFPWDLKTLSALKIKEIRAKYPNVPEHALAKPKPYKDSTANGLTKCIIDAINLSGGQAERISNTGRVIDNSYTYTNVVGQQKTIGGVKFVPGTGTNGTADISAIWQGKSLKIELKIGRDKLSEAQKRYRDKVEASGGIYIVARSYEGFVEALERRLNDE
ncbi:hypothetical protein [Echinicola rosea]|uniref:VRR-NUC domain-containing protein n=1 Tax=Echinicola rosea TaxID=1807691 RepID=A0ABQ1V343_9BACT|nr:hypothetical protein [Echinicola rosea]GGF34429.1 hypothetical protein GCM10011339_23350 [Echinicola rosea]